MERQYGLWDSEISIDLLSNKSTSFDTIHAQPHGSIYLLESRSDGKNMIVEVRGKQDVKDILPSEYSVGTQVHEYGGAAFAIDTHRRRIIFSNQSDQGVYTVDLATSDVELIVKHAGWRFADFDIHPDGLIVCIREIHDPANDTPNTVINELVLIDPASKTVKPLISGNDFYSNAHFDPEGKLLSWMERGHPEMPWTGSQLFIANFDASSGSISNSKPIGGAKKERSVSQPRWGSNGVLFFADDITGYWQIYSFTPSTGNVSKVQTTGLDNADHAGAEFFLGSRTYLPLLEDKLLLTYQPHGTQRFAIVDLPSGTSSDLPLPAIDIVPSGMAQISPIHFAIIGTPPTSSTMHLWEVRLDPTTSSPSSTLLHRSAASDPPAGYVPHAEALQFPRTQGKFREGVVHGFLFRPRNPAFSPPPGTLPPAIVWAHGGPTSHAKPALTPEFQYWTSRGYAVFAVNYAGSTGFGRGYRDLLNGEMGVLDVADTASAAVGLAAAGLVDGSRMAVYGRSAGGYVVLKTICDQPRVWAAAVSLFGIADFGELLETTHKFESRYADALLWGVGRTLDRAEKERILLERSPVAHAGNVEAPTLLLQGEEDKVVPPEQARRMERALREKGKTVRLEMFEGQGHAYWRGEARRRQMGLMEEWFRKYLLRVE